MFFCGIYCLNLELQVNDQFDGGYTSIGFNFTYGQPENVGDFTQDLGSGRSDGF